MYVVGIAMESMIFANQLLFVYNLQNQLFVYTSLRIFGCLFRFGSQLFFCLHFVDKPFACLLEGSCKCGEGRICYCFFNQNDF